MTEPNVEGHFSFFNKKMTRRGFLKLGAAAALILLPSCRRDLSVPPPETPLPENVPLPDQIITWIKEGKEMRTQEDLNNLNDLYPGIDLPYSYLPTVRAIRGVPDPRQKVSLAVGYLDVEHSKRYSWRNPDGTFVYACNIYALDLLRLVTGNDAIGSRYDKRTGQPFSFGPRDLDWSNKAAVRANFDRYPFIHSNNGAWWLEKYGRNYGWYPIATQEKLLQKLDTGEVIVWGISSQEQIRKKREEDPTFLGHSFVIFSPERGLFGLTQATWNILAQAYPAGSSFFKVQPERGEFVYWGHPIMRA